MTYLQITFLHLATVLPAFIIGTYLLFSRKGSATHKKLGRVYLSLMLVTAILTLFMSAQVGPTFLGHFGFIHLLSVLVLVLVFVPSAYHAARTGNVRLHRNNMIGLYFGGLIVAGSFAISPGRFLHQWLLG
ncbi:MAG: putative membrane protein [Gammaproteobacteria bacterium]